MLALSVDLTTRKSQTTSFINWTGEAFALSLRSIHRATFGPRCSPSGARYRIGPLAFVVGGG